MDSYSSIPLPCSQFASRNAPASSTTAVPPPEDSCQDRAGFKATLVTSPVDAFPPLQVAGARCAGQHCSQLYSKDTCRVILGRNGQHLLQWGPPLLLSHTAPCKSSAPHGPLAKPKCPCLSQHNRLWRGFCCKMPHKLDFYRVGGRQRVVSSLSSQPLGADGFGHLPATFHPSE